MFFLSTVDSIAVEQIIPQRVSSKVIEHRRSYMEIQLSKYAENLRRNLRDGSQKSNFEWVEDIFARNPDANKIEKYKNSGYYTSLNDRFSFELNRLSTNDARRNRIFDGLTTNLILEALKKHSAVLIFDEDLKRLSKDELSHFIANFDRDSFDYFSDMTQKVGANLKVTIFFQNANIGNKESIRGQFFIWSNPEDGNMSTTSFMQKAGLFSAKHPLDLSLRKIVSARYNQSRSNKTMKRPSALPIQRKAFNEIIAAILTEVPVNAINPQALGHGVQPEIQRCIFEYAPGDDGVSRGVEIEVKRSNCCGFPYEISSRHYNGKSNNDIAPFLPSDISQMVLEILAEAITCDKVMKNTPNHYSDEGIF